MKTCVAPQTRKYWMDTFKRVSDDEVLNHLKWANNGLHDHGRTSQRHRHDWTIYRACAIRELRRRGLEIPS